MKQEIRLFDIIYTWKMCRVIILGLLLLIIGTEVTWGQTAEASNSGPVCVGSPLLLYGGPDGMSSYSWTGPNGFTSSIQNPQVTSSATLNDAGEYVLTINGTSSATTTVLVIAIITPTFTQLGPYCIGSIPEMLPGTSLNGISGTWSPATISTSSAGTTEYTFTPTAGQCATTATMNVVVNSLPVVSITGSSSICVGATTTLTPTSDGTWVSSNTSVATVSTAGEVTGIAAGTASFTFTSATTGCSNSTGVVTVTATNTVGTASSTPTLCISTALTPITHTQQGQRV